MTPAAPLTRPSIMIVDDEARARCRGEGKALLSNLGATQNARSVQAGLDKDAVRNTLIPCYEVGVCTTEWTSAVTNTSSTSATTKSKLTVCTSVY